MRWSGPPWLRVVAAIGLVAAVAGMARLFDVDLTVAALLLLVTVFVAGALGTAAGITAAVAGFFALNYFFTEPTGSLKIQRSDDVVALIVFTLSAVLVSWTVQRLATLRHAALDREHDARVQLELSNQLLSSHDVAEALPAAAHAIREIFEFTACDLHAGEHHAHDGASTRDVNVHVEAGGVALDAYAQQELGPGED